MKKNIQDKISFEIFPPKVDVQNEGLFEELSLLKRFNPAFISLTCGAGGGNVKSNNLVETIANSGFEVMPHFTCVCSSKEFVKDYIQSLNQLKITNILALRGDIPEDKSICCHDFRYANELVEYLKLNSSLSLGVAGYPEGHIETPDLKLNIEHLKLKIDAGAEAVFTQLFFDKDKFISYAEKVNCRGIDVPIIPGIMPILSYKQIEKMTSIAKITIPQKLGNALEKYKDDSASLKAFGIDYISQMCHELLQYGVDGLHFFTLNKSYASSKILENIL